MAHSTLSLRPTKRPVTARNPLVVVLLILSPRRVAISLEESPCWLLIGTNFIVVWQFHSQALAQRATRRNLVAPISPTLHARLNRMCKDVPLMIMPVLLHRNLIHTDSTCKKLRCRLKQRWEMFASTKNAIELICFWIPSCSEYTG